MNKGLTTLVVIAALAFWGGVAAVVLDYNLGLGTTTLRWPRPDRPTAAWSWDARAVTPEILEPRSGQWLRVTLPRGFVTGTLSVVTQQNATLSIQAEPRIPDHKISETTLGTTHALSIRFSELVARGRTFRFRLANQTDDAITLKNMQLIVQR